MEARIEQFSSWIKYSDSDTHSTELASLLKEAGFTILNSMEHHFEPQGFTALWLLAESHCALHTFPEEGKAYVELSSCNIKMYVTFVKLFHTKYHGIN